MDLYSFQIITLGTGAANEQATWLQYLAALLTPLVAALGIWIAFNQWKTARMKLKLDLFDKRVVVYEAVELAVRKAVIGDIFTEETLSDYVKGTAGTRWLFDEKMKRFTFELFELFCQLLSIDDMPKDAPPEIQSVFVSKESEAIEKITAHWEVLDSKFAPFLSLGH